MPIVDIREALCHFFVYIFWILHPSKTNFKIHRRLWRSGIRVAYADLTNPRIPAFDREAWVLRVAAFLQHMQDRFGVRTGLPMVNFQIENMVTSFIVHALIAQAGVEADRGDDMASVTHRRNELIFEGFLGCVLHRA